MRCGLVYALCDGEGTPYYVGRTTRSPGERLGEHRREATRRGRRSPCHLRTLELVEAGEGPRIWVLEDRIALAKVLRREQHWISYGEGAGWDLLNYRGGGDGKLIWSTEDRRRQAAIAAAFPRDEFQRFMPPGWEPQVQARRSVREPASVLPEFAGDIPF